MNAQQRKEAKAKRREKRRPARDARKVEARRAEKRAIQARMAGRDPAVEAQLLAGIHEELRGVK